MNLLQQAKINFLGLKYGDFQTGPHPIEPAWVLFIPYNDDADALVVDHDGDTFIAREQDKS